MRLTIETPTPRPEYSDALERGSILYFPTCPIALPPAEDLGFLRDDLPQRLARKNVSFYPSANRLVGVEGAEQAERSRRILSEHSQRVRDFLGALLPTLVPGWKIGTSSFRPLQEKGRDLSAHASNELIHVDAGAYGATHGDRILRFFVNVHPTEHRVWATRGTFESLFARYRDEAGLEVGSLSPGPFGKAFSWTLRKASAVAPMAAMLDSSPYDRRMRKFHNFMKDTPAFQGSPEGREEFSFPPMSAWMVFTDTLSHACLSGQHALVDTFIVPLRNCRVTQSSPYHLLSGAAQPSTPAERPAA